MKHFMKKPGRGVKSVLMISLLAISIILAFTACSEAKPQTAPAQSSKPAASAPQSPNPSPKASEANPAVTASTSAKPLSEADKVISLESYGSKGALSDKNLTIADMLMYAVQDEYAARDEYKAIIDKFGSQNPFNNIMFSEESHLASLKEVYTLYGLKFPENTSAGHLVIPDNLLQANKTGVQAEIDNIAMYERFLKLELPQPIRDVFNILKSASENHLSAFKKQVDKLS